MRFPWRGAKKHERVLSLDATGCARASPHMFLAHMSMVNERLGVCGVLKTGVANLVPFCSNNALRDYKATLPRVHSSQCLSEVLEENSELFWIDGTISQIVSWIASVDEIEFQFAPITFAVPRTNRSKV